MGKKKISLKPVNRGFATTSVVSKKKVEEQVTASVASDGNDSSEVPPGEGDGTTEAGGSGVKSAGTNGEAIKEDWEDEAFAEQTALQSLVDRLHEKGEKEVSRIVKAIEYDKRLSSSFAPLRMNESIRDQVLSLALQDSTQEVKTTGKPSTAAESDKNLLRLFVAFHVLAKLGFPEARISQCLLEGLEEGGGWDEAIDWMWLHLSEDECLRKGDFVQNEDILVDEVEEDLLPMPETPSTPASTAPSTKPVTPARATTPPPPGQSTSMFQSIDTAADGDTQSDDSSEVASEPDLQKVNTVWAKLALELDGLKVAAGGVKGKGKKGKSSGVILESPDMRRLKEKMGVLEKDYMFSRKEADILFKAAKAKRDSEILRDRLSGRTKAPEVSTGGAESPEEPVDDVVVPEDRAEDHISDDGDDGGGLFGNMLDEPAPSLPDLELGPGPSTAITTRSMPIPKQVAYSGSTPKALLRTTLLKSHKSASIQYVPLSGHSRSARAGLQIALAPKRRRVWRMDDIACDDMQEAENYVATLALHALMSNGEVQGVNPKVFPPAHRDLWDELEVERKKKEDEGRRGVWKMIKDIYDQKAVVGDSVVETSSKVEAANGDTRNGVDGARKQPDFVDQLQRDYIRRYSSRPYQSMLPQRNSLPIATFRQTIIDTLQSNQVMVLSGETGCGKSTQLPAYILEDQLSQGKPCKIFVTEPRRISAISLAQRVSAELGDLPGQMGTNSSLVGYSIRLEAKTSPSTRLAFVTNGIALRMLESGSAPGKSTAFDEVTHIIVDEVHERSIDSDFLLIVLRQLMVTRPELKVVLMSATLDADKISTYFGGCPVLVVPGRTFPVQVNYLEDAVELSGWNIDEGSSYAVRPRNAKMGAKQLEWAEGDDSDDEEESSANPAKLSSKLYSALTVSTVNLLDSKQIHYELIVRLLERICFEDNNLQPFSAAVLVFMPGLAEIRKLTDMLSGHREFGSRGFMLYPLHSTISSEGQSAVFDIPPNGVRKIVISTNIAETGVTIPDITCVIDSGKHREMRYDEKRQISRLVETYIARSNAKQRRGRAGRVREGIAFHLFSKNRHDTQLADHPIPEMLRLSLQDLALRIKILRLKLGTTIEEVLLKAMDPPTSLNIQRAIASLVEVKALTGNEDITPMGRLLSKLPMDVHLGKFLLVAAMMRCLDPALTIAATLNSKSPWVTPFGQENQARTVKQAFAIDHSDFFTIVNVFKSWRRASDNPHFVPVFCRKNFVSQQNLQQIEELRQQLLSYLVDSGFVSVSSEQKREISQARYSRAFKTRFVSVPPQFNDNAEDLHILGAALASGLYPKILSIDANGGLKTITNQQPTSIHPSSVNFKIRPSEFGTSHLAYFTIMQSKRLYAWEVGPVDDRALALLCGDQADVRASAGSVQLDRKIRFSVNPKTGIAVKILREQFASVMHTKMRGKLLNESQERWWELGMRCLSVGIYDWEDEGPGVGVNLN